jgi:hypothetical protein
MGLRRGHHLGHSAAAGNGGFLRANYWPGEVEVEHEFDVSLGLAGLRELVQIIQGTRVGIKLIGNVGMTSHIADLLRRHRVPSRIVAKAH